MSQDVTDLGKRLNLVGLAATNPLQNGVYAAGLQPSDPLFGAALSPQFLAGNGNLIQVSVEALFDAATALTDIRVKLQGLPRPEFAGLLGSDRYIDLKTYRVGADTSLTEHIFVASAGNPVCDVLQFGAVSSLAVPRFFYKFQLIAKATALAPKAGDAAIAYVNAF